jgi:protein ImuB
MGSDPISGWGGTGSRLLAVARLFSPRVEAQSDTVITLEIDGLTRLFGDDKAVGGQLRRMAADAGLGPVHVGVAATRTTAILCAAARAGVTVVPAGEEAAVLAPLPLRTLEVFLPAPDSQSRSHGTPKARAKATPNPQSLIPNPAILSVLSRWGVRTLGQLAALPAVELSERIGQEGLAWQHLARGEDAGPLVPTREDDPFEATVELEWPIEGIEPLSFVLGGLLDPLCQRLERRDRGAAVLHLHLRLVTKDTHTRSLQLPAPMRDAKVLRTLLLLDLESHQPSAGVDRVTVVIDPTPGRIVQESLLTRSLPAPEQVSTLLARLGALMGNTRCGSPALVDSHRPGAFAMMPFRVPDSPFATPKVGARHAVPLRCSLGSPRSSVAGTRAGLSAPREIEGEPGVPRQLPAPSTCLRRFRLPIPARVLIDHDRPIVVNTDRPGLTGGRVHACAGPWRTSGEWWKTIKTQGASGVEALRGLSGWNRDEWDVMLGDGGLYRIFEDRESGRWFIEATVD